MFRQVVFFFLFSGVTLVAKAQTKETSDPMATRLLDKISKRYESFKAVDLDFNLVIEVPGEKKQIQKGKVSQAKNSYRLAMDQQTIISDGKTNWIYLKKNNEVQITNADPNDANGLLTPNQLLQLYKKGDYLYAIIDKVSENGVILTQIEFKPVDKKSEYAKIRLEVNEKSQLISSVKAFAKDGSRYTFAVTKHNTAAKHPEGYFSFDKSQFPGAHIEDLRM